MTSAERAHELRQAARDAGGAPPACTGGGAPPSLATLARAPDPRAGAGTSAAGGVTFPSPTAPAAVARRRGLLRGNRLPHPIPTRSPA